MILLIYLLNMCFLSQVINASKSENNIVMSGGHGGGCKDSGGGGALVMQNGKKGKKNEKLIIKDDALIMQDSQADGNIIMDGNNLVFQEGKKSENIIIKGGGGGGDCCHQDIHHREEHVHHPPPHVIPVHHFKKKEVHHHHSKEVHHHDDDLGLGSRRRDAGTEPENDAVQSSPASEKEKNAKRKPKKRKPKMRKLKLGDKLSVKEKEHLKLRARADSRRLGLPRFRLAGKVMDKIRWRKSSQKTNSPDKAKEIKQEEPPGKEAASGEQQYEDEENEENGRDQEDDEPAGSNLYEGMASALYPAALNPHPMSTSYMTNSFGGVLDPSALYSSPVLMPASTGSSSDRRDLKKKHVKKQAKRIKKSETVKAEHIKEDNGHQQKTGSEKSGSDQSEEVDNNSGETGGDDEEDDNSLKLNKTINQAIEATTAASSAALKGTNLLQPVFAPTGRQLTPLYSLITLTNGAQNRLALSPNHLNQAASATATLPLFTPAKPAPLDSSAALLLKLIEHQSHQQQQLIRAQHKKLLEQEVRQKELTKQLQQATEEKQKEKLQDDFPKDEEPELHDRTKERAADKSKLLYANELDYWDKFVEDDKYARPNGHDRLSKYDKASINRLRRRKSEANQSDRSTQPMSLIKKSKQEQLLRAARVNDEEFNFSDFDEDLESAPGKRLRNQRQFKRRMLSTEPEFGESNRVANVTTSQPASNDGPNGDSDKRPASDPSPPTAINEMKLASNASLIVYGY